MPPIPFTAGFSAWFPPPLYPTPQPADQASTSQLTNTNQFLQFMTSPLLVYSI